jgi:hypothetical protein
MNGALCLHPIKFEFEFQWVFEGRDCWGVQLAMVGP